MAAVPVGKAEARRTSAQPSGARSAILASGPMLAPAMAAVEELDATVVKMRFVKPIDAELVHRMALTHDSLFTVEEGSVISGADFACVEAMLAGGRVRPVLQLGLPDCLIDMANAAPCWPMRSGWRRHRPLHPRTVFGLVGGEVGRIAHATPRAADAARRHWSPSAARVRYIACLPRDRAMTNYRF